MRGGQSRIATYGRLCNSCVALHEHRSPDLCLVRAIIDGIEDGQKGPPSPLNSTRESISELAWSRSQRPVTSAAVYYSHRIVHARIREDNESDISWETIAWGVSYFCQYDGTICIRSTAVKIPLTASLCRKKSIYTFTSPKFHVSGRRASVLLRLEFRASEQTLLRGGSQKFSRACGARFLHFYAFRFP